MLRTERMWMRPLRAVLNCPPGWISVCIWLCRLERNSLAREDAAHRLELHSPKHDQWWEHAAYPAELLLEGCFNHETAQCWSYNSRQGITDEYMLHIKSPFDWRDDLPSSTFTLTYFLLSSPRSFGFAYFHCSSTAVAILPSFQYIFTYMFSGSQNGVGANQQACENWFKQKWHCRP